MTVPPAELIGRFGEHFASQWLKKQGYDIRSFWDLYVKLKYGTLDAQQPIPEDELRRRMVQSLEARIPGLGRQLSEAEALPSPSRKVKNWIERERLHLPMMVQALADLRIGKPLKDIREEPNGYLDARLRAYHPEWQLYQEVDSEAEAREFLGARTDDFLKYLDECNALSREQLGGTMSPDIVARKDGDIYLVEVKANEAELAPLQRRALDLAAKYGFKTKVVRVRFEARCEEEGVWKRPPSAERRQTLKSSL